MAFAAGVAVAFGIAVGVGGGRREMRKRRGKVVVVVVVDCCRRGLAFRGVGKGKLAGDGGGEGDGYDHLLLQRCLRRPL